MSNLANIQKLNYCEHRMGNRSTCDKIATHIVKICKRGIIDFNMTTPRTEDYRCDFHKETGTVSKKVYEIKEYDQELTKNLINRFLKSIIGKSIESQAHSARNLEVKFLKENCGVMCIHPITKKWKFVYYHQITKVL